MDLATSSSTLRDGLDGERGDLLETLRLHRGFLRHTLTGLTEEQARATPTASALSVGPSAVCRTTSAASSPRVGPRVTIATGVPFWTARRTKR